MQGPVDRHWPPTDPPAAADAVRADCAHCKLRWAVHRSMAGFRLRCECGQWLAVPALPGADLLPGPGVQDASSAEQGAAAGASPAAVPGHLASRTSRPPAVVDRSPVAWHDPTPRPVSGLAEDAGRRARQIDGGLLELVLLFLAFVGPASAAQLLAGERLLPALLPFAGMVSGLLVLGIGALFNPVVLTSSLRRAPAHLWFEALAMTAVFLAAAFGMQELLAPLTQDQPSWIAELVAEVGLGWALFTVAVCPGVFEELAFRGQVHARLTSFFGRTQGQLLTATAFALAHGITPALPLHFGIGLYLGSLRVRANSLLPGMLLHMLYNGTLVIAEG